MVVGENERASAGPIVENFLGIAQVDYRGLYMILGQTLLKKMYLHMIGKADFLQYSVRPKMIKISLSVCVDSKSEKFICEIASL